MLNSCSPPYLSPLCVLSLFPSLRCFSVSSSCSSPSRLLKRAAYNRRVFSDRIRIQATGGRGGSGCSSFARTMKGIGAPNGGNGGAGGDVWVTCADNTQQGYTMSSYHYQGGKGENGSSDNSTGKKGGDTEIVVPSGSVLSLITSHDMFTQHLHTSFIADLTQPNQRVLVARGGAGGLGNRAYMTGYRSNNKFSSKGSDGESKWLMLELRCIADVGLVGFPNAGKSSLLDACSKAQPKIASYPFTTMQPQVGVVEVTAKLEHTKTHNRKKQTMQTTNSPTPIDTHGASVVHPTSLTPAQLAFQSLADDDEADSATSSSSSLSPDPSTAMNTFSMADLPGLINDAHQDVGLGHSFLQHLQRCSVLLYVIDVAGGEDVIRSHSSDSHDIMPIYDLHHLPATVAPKVIRDPCEDFVALRRELRLYDPRLLQKPWMVFANQMDRKPTTSKKNLQRLQEVIDSELQLEKGMHKQQAVGAVVGGANMSTLSPDQVLIGGSCVKRKGLQELVTRLYDLVQRMQQQTEQIQRAEAVEAKRKEAAEEAAARIATKARHRTSLNPQRRTLVPREAVAG